LPNSVCEIRDPIHGFVKLNETELKLVNTNAFQRLRGIRQLAMASLVYPGALHTRFDHSLGVFHVADSMATALEQDSEARELIRYAALLHDIGHGPFSHVSEYALDRYADRTKIPEGSKQEKIHEIVTAAIIASDTEIGKILGRSKCANIVELLTAGYGEPTLRSVVSGPLDADKQDYLLRDSYFCGVRYGLFDIHQLHLSLVPIRHDGTKELMLKPDGVHAVEQYVLAKYYMTTNVYRHKVRLITDQMIVRAIELGIDSDNIDTLSKLYNYNGSQQFVENYTHWDDARFLNVFGGQEHDGTKCHAMLQRLIQRNLLKRGFQDTATSFSARARETATRLSRPENAGARRTLEAEIAQELTRISGVETDPSCVILHTFSIKSVKEMSRNDEAGILVDCSPNPAFFVDKSSLFASIQKGYDEQFVEVYAPVIWPSRERRQDLLEEFHGPLLRIIETRCSGNAIGEQS